MHMFKRVISICRLKFGSLKAIQVKTSVGYIFINRAEGCFQLKHGHTAPRF